MEKWEYMQIVQLKAPALKRTPAPWDDDPNLMVPSLTRLNELGQKGWRLASSKVYKGTTTYTLMRPVGAK